ncbi:MAG: transcriptional repressor [Elusimicrobiaceae bacterium]|nr:transcriptional repressor [Elusimicrobiaceae bacterium]
MMLTLTEPADVQMRLDYFETRCKELGLRITRQRQEIFRAVAQSNAHPSAETVFLQVRESLPNVSLDTVYRTLSSLEEMGLLHQVGLSSKARFDGDLRPHCHFVCTKCGEVYDVFPQEHEQISWPSSAQNAGEIKQVNVQFKGICKNCTRL